MDTKKDGKLTFEELGHAFGAKGYDFAIQHKIVGGVESIEGGVTGPVEFGPIGKPIGPSSGIKPPQ